MSQPSTIASRRADGAPDFFLPLADDDAGEQGAAYERLVEAAAASAQRRPRSRRIFRMHCRLNGRDCSVQVGEPLPGGDDTVAAIIDVGGDDRYFVYGTTPSRPPLLRIGQRSVYEVLEFA